ncbi:hypothetical protein D1BOALGB6SA_9104 [Olavius sp. associated proteobacterium Delta 1]|nr:hypothetical protein D1BOALGB6SA_9104 [Olavius sp. associated proteobacterium Delta 1]
MRNAEFRKWLPAFRLLKIPSFPLCTMRSTSFPLSALTLPPSTRLPFDKLRPRARRGELVTGLVLSFRGTDSQMPPDLQLKKETILNAVDQYENDAVIITQLIGKKQEDVYTRGGPVRMGFFSYTRDPGYSSSNTTVRLETNLVEKRCRARKKPCA